MDRAPRRHDKGATTIPPETGERPDSGHAEIPGWTLQEWSRRLEPLLRETGQPRYRTGQLLRWVFQRRAPEFGAMTDLPAAFRERLESEMVLHPLEVLVEKRSADGTRKFLWKRDRGDPIESVWIPDGKRDTFCISTQSGCPVKCTFCATGFGGFSGQLSTGEIVDQVLVMSICAGVSPTNVVFMGMGEPLLNFPNVLRAIQILCEEKQVGMGARRITVSTVGVPDRIVELGRAHPQVKLALSLHAARDELRDLIIPLNRRYPLREILAAIRQHGELTGKLATFEYILLPGINDQTRDVADLTRILRGIPSRINIIGFNPFPGASYRKPDVRELVRFRNRLQRHYSGAVTIRRSRGEDIDGACGQLTLKAAAAR